MCVCVRARARAPLSRVLGDDLFLPQSVSVVESGWILTGFSQTGLSCLLGLCRAVMFIAGRQGSLVTGPGGPLQSGETLSQQNGRVLFPRFRASVTGLSILATPPPTHTHTPCTYTHTPYRPYCDSNNQLNVA